MNVNGIDHYGDIANFARSVVSQDGSDGIIEEVFKRIGVSSGVFIEMGAGDGVSISNSRNLLSKGWRGVLIEASPDHFRILEKNTKDDNVVRINEKVNCEPETNLDALLDRYTIGEEIDLFSLDIDSIEYWIWKSMKRKPKLMIVEYNSNFEFGQSKSVEYEPNLCWDLSNYYGASVSAFEKVAKEQGYTLIGCSNGLNLFYIKNDFKDKFTPLNPQDIPKNWAWPPKSRVMVDV